MNFDFIVVGSGLSGSTIARKLADDGMKVLIVEKRDNIAGNLYDYYTNDGVLIQKYGPHTFHTNDKEVIKFVTRFAKFDKYTLKCQVKIGSILTPSPFNFKTIDQFYGKNSSFLKEKLLKNFPNNKATIFELMFSKDKDIKKYGNFLFNKDYSLYTSKQWGIKAKDIDVSVLNRVPIEFSYKDSYFYNTFEGIPVKGFTNFIKSMLNSENIFVKLNENAIKHISFKGDQILYDGDAIPIVYTGKIDELFDYEFEELPYRSLYFKFEKHKLKDFQTSAIVAFPSHRFKYTRITEYTKIPYQKCNFTWIAKEYSIPYVKGQDVDPYYPILTLDSISNYEHYYKKSLQYKNLFLLGRLAEFKYYNMDQVVSRCLDVYDKVKDLKK